MKLLLILILALVLLSGCENFGCVNDNQCIRDFEGGCQKDISSSEIEPSGNYSCRCDHFVCLPS